MRCFALESCYSAEAGNVHHLIKGTIAMVENKGTWLTGRFVSMLPPLKPSNIFVHCRGATYPMS